MGDTKGPAQRDRRVLMICYYFPPIRASGTARSVEFAVRLPQHGWYPLVLTVREAKDRWSHRQEPEPEGIEVYRTREIDLHGVVTFLHGVTSRLVRIAGVRPRRNLFYDYLCVPDAQIAWNTTRPGVRVARKADVIYASCSPFSSALSACRIKRRTGLPLVLDFRDPWSVNTHRLEPWRRSNAIRRYERAVVSECDHLVLNSDGAVAAYRSLYPDMAEKFSVIPNGYDQNNSAPPRDRTLQAPFRIMHVGHFYGTRQPDNLLEAIRSIGDPSIEFVQVGDPFPAMESFRDSVRIRMIPSVPRREALRLMTTASLLYLVQGDVRAERDIAVAAKTYEYLATGLPIVAECPPGDNADLVSRFAAYGFVVAPGDEQALTAALRAAIVARNDAVPRVDETFERLYNRDYLTGKLAAVLDAVVSRKLEISARAGCDRRGGS